MQSVGKQICQIPFQKRFQSSLRVRDFAQRERSSSPASRIWDGSGWHANAMQCNSPTPSRPDGPTPSQNPQPQLGETWEWGVGDRRWSVSSVRVVVVGGVSSWHIYMVRVQQPVAVGRVGPDGRPKRPTGQGRQTDSVSERSCYRLPDGRTCFKPKQTIGFTCSLHNL